MCNTGYQQKHKAYILNKLEKKQNSDQIFIDGNRNSKNIVNTLLYKYQYFVFILLSNKRKYLAHLRQSFKVYIIPFCEVLCFPFSAVVHFISLATYLGAYDNIANYAADKIYKC